MSDQTPVPPDLVDGVKATPVVAFLGAVVGGWSVEHWAALAALIYSLILIVDKLRAWGLFRWLARSVAGFGHPRA